MNDILKLRDSFTKAQQVKPDLPYKMAEVDCTDDEGMIVHSIPETGGPDDLVGRTIGIEYINGEQKFSRRWIAIHRLEGVKTWDQCFLFGHCFLRARFRCFRLDRIQTVFDQDGVIYDKPREFFAKPPILEITDTAHALRAISIDGVRTLVALGRCDQHFHKLEITCVHKYIGEIADFHGVKFANEDLNSLTKWIKQQRPTHEHVGQALYRIMDKDIFEQKCLLKHAHNLMNADGVQHPNEFDFILNAQNQYLYNA